ncbi:UNVERIFIED_CONTAM: hypothetical protein NCL1_41140 [Trichonephila clavipes]
MYSVWNGQREYVKGRSHASQIPSSNQSPPCHSADRKNPLSSSPTSKFYQDMGLRTVLQSGCPKENAYSTPIQKERSLLTFERA